tara:strand:- start:416 stop:520 length:105 start_codon:yes stop_codon:yes gene_type:complete
MPTDGDDLFLTQENEAFIVRVTVKILFKTKQETK